MPTARINNFNPAERFPDYLRAMHELSTSNMRIQRLEERVSTLEKELRASELAAIRQQVCERLLLQEQQRLIDLLSPASHRRRHTASQATATSSYSYSHPDTGDGNGGSQLQAARQGQWRADTGEGNVDVVRVRDFRVQPDTGGQPATGGAGKGKGNGYPHVSYNGKAYGPMYGPYEHRTAQGYVVSMDVDLDAAPWRGTW